MTQSMTDPNRCPTCAWIYGQHAPDCSRTQTRWVNFYPPIDDMSAFHPWRTSSWVSKELADRNAKQGRLACVKVEFSEGEGLDTP